METILITGASGFLGSHLTDFCIKQGKMIYGIDLPNQPLYNLNHYTDGKLSFSSEEKINAFDVPIQIPTTNINFVFFSISFNS